MEKLIKSSKNQVKMDELRTSWSEASNYPQCGDVDAIGKYVEMLERKVIEQNKTIEILEGKIEALDGMRKLWAKGEIEN